MKAAKPLPDIAVPPWRLLLWLKLKLVVRGMRRDRMKAANAIMMLIAFAPFSLGIAWGVYSFSTSVPHLSHAIFNATFAAIFIMWVTAPVLGYAMNEAADPERLFAYPVSYRVIAACAVLGGVFELSTLLMIPVLIAMIAASSHNIGDALGGTAVAIVFVVVTLALAQTVLLAMIGLLRSRKFKDLAIVLLPVVGVAFYVGQNAAFRATHVGEWERMLNNPLLQAFAYLPSGWAASALSALSGARYPEAAAYLCASLVLLAVTLVAAGALMRRLSLGERGVLSPRSSTSPPVNASPPIAAKPESRLSPEMHATVEKEFRSLKRDPQYKAVFVQMIYMLVVMIMPWLQIGSVAHHDSPAVPSIMRHLAPLLAATIVTSIFLPLAFNILGGEGRAITVLLSTPAPRRAIIVAKNMVHAAILAPVPLIVVGAGCVLTHNPPLIGIGVLWVAIELATLLGIGNIVSMLLPHRMVVRGQGYQRPGCGYVLLQLLAYAAGTVALLVPAAALGLAEWRNAPLLTIGMIALATAYAAIIYATGVSIAARLLTDREPEIVARLAAE